MRSNKNVVVNYNLKALGFASIALAMIFSLFPQTIPYSPIGSAAANGNVNVGSGSCIQSVSSAEGVTVTQSGADCVIEFKNSGSVNWNAPAGVNNIQLLVVGGGGGGGGGSRGTTDGARGAGGGGAGGRVYFNNSVPLTATGPFAISIGAGGAGGLANNNNAGYGAAGAAGSASSISGTGITTITAAGGGAGGRQTGDGASDGGGDGGSTASIVNNVTTNRTGGVNSYEGAGGGAGAGANGANGTDIGGRGGNGGNGGNGFAANITGSSVVFGGGGGGGGTAGDSLNGTAGRGGTGGGGNGGIYLTSPVAGTANFGGGGGGGGGWRAEASPARNGAAGGSGVVIIRYTPPCAASTTGLGAAANLVLYLDAANTCSTGTAGRWRDVSGNGRDLIWGNAAVAKSEEPKFYDFVRSSSHHGRFGSDGLTNFSTGLSFSFSAKFDANASFERIIDFGNGAPNNNIVIAREGATSKLNFTAYNGTTLVLRYESPDQMIVDGEWAHYAITVSASDNNDPVKMYRNGQLQTSLRVNKATGSTYLPATGVRNNYYLGRSNWSADPYFDGGIRSFAIYNTAIDQTAVTANAKVQSRSIPNQTKITDGGSVYNTTIFSSVGSNTFVVPDGVTSVDVLAVGGGGGAGFGNCGGGGGAGRVITKNSVAVTPGQIIEVFVGGGGTGGWRTYSTLWTRGTNGIASTIKIGTDTFTASGGGGGGGSNANFVGNAGGSGGGGVACGTIGAAGAADTSDVTGFTTYQNVGSAGVAGVGGGGGGGAGAAATGKNGGAALSIWGAVLAGGGSGWASGSGGGVGGTTVGGAAFSGTTSAAASGSPGVFSTGSGGGGGNSGASGRVAIRFGNPCDPTGSGITATGQRIGNDCLISITAGSNATLNIPDSVNQFSVLVVGGGGGGGFDAGAGGGGGAVYIGTVTPQSGTSRTATITIGAGGNPSRHSNGTNGSAGGNSIFSMSAGGAYSITSPGGGLGGNSGASTGGAAGVGGASPTITDNSTDISGAQLVRAAGGTGGAGVPYNSTNAAIAGTGGITQTDSSPFPGSYGGGGGGGATQYGASTPGRAGAAGIRGGGNGSGGYDSTAGRVTSFATAGAANTGGGGGGGSAHGSTALYSINGENWYSRDAKAGGTGIIKLRYSLDPKITLAQSDISTGVNDAVTSYVITNTGGKPVVTDGLDAYTVTPALPTGISLNATTGVISGSSAVTVPSATYTFTARNSFGTSSATFTLQVVTGSKPIKPVIDFIAPGDAQLKVKVTPPVTNPVITGYKYSINGGAFSAVQSLTNSFITISGVTNTTSYAVKIIAVNAVGESVESDPVSSTPYPACLTKTTNTATNVVVEITSTTTCSWPIPTSGEAEMLVVAGGGGGGHGWGGGGGGGGVLHSTAQPLIAGDAIVVKVGAGGTGGTTTTASSKGSNGQDSTINFTVSGARTTYTAKGGGGGGGYGWGGGISIGTGLTGGSAGGHGEIPSGTSLGRVNGTQANAGTFIGYAGAGGSMYGGGSQAGSGGGGAGGDGGNAASYRAPGVGGAGRLFRLVSEEGVYYAGGGGGGSVTGAAGGIGGGGRGSNTNSTATAGTDGLGGGGGGASNGSGGNGGSGVVVIKFANTAAKTTFDGKNDETPREIAQASFTASPFTPIRLGYSFNGWFEAETGGTAISYPYTSDDKTLYAQWTVKSCAVSETNFVGNGTNGGTSGVTYRVFRFTTPGDCVWSLPQGLTSLDVLAVGGGGGGGGAFDTGGAGGGAGGQVKEQTINVSAVSELTLVVGAGGSAGRGQRTSTPPETAGGNGLASELYANGVRIVTALGGDGGSASRADYFVAAGLAGRNVGTGGAAATATTPARGGAHGDNASSATQGDGGGGGGSAAAGWGAGSTNSRAGGLGVESKITGTATRYGSGGSGGNGTGTTTGTSNGSAGAVNLGNGGGGASSGSSSSFSGGSGGSGIVILRTEVNAQKYTITYNTTGGTALSAGSFVAGGTVTQPANPIRAGYTLSGWALTEGGAALTFPYTPTTNQNLTLFALWGANQISVVFNANDGTTTSSVQTITAGTRTALTLNTFERVGYEFAGWSTNANGTGTKYSDGDNVELLSPTELYANWEAKELTVTYLKNDGTEDKVEQTETGSPARAIKAGDSFVLRANTFTRAGYVFSGWTNSAGEKVGDQATVRIFVDGRYFANWTPIEFTVTYQLNGGSGSAPTQANVAAGGTFTVAAAPTRTNYTFAGWSDGSVVRDPNTNQPIGSKLYQAGETYTLTGGNVVLTAQWSSPEFIVGYDKNGGSGELAVTSQSVLAGGSVILAGRGTLTKAGYSFGGWSTVEAGTDPKAVGASLTPTVDTTLYAVWIATYVVTYNANGGLGDLAKLSDSFVSGSTAITLPTRGSLVKTGYDFGGWSTTPSGTAVDNPYTPTDNVTLFARWIPTTYVVTYDLNGGTGSLLGSKTSDSFTVNGTAITLPAGADLGTLARANYSFGGWATTFNGSAVSSPYTPTSNVKLYAVWISTITYNLNSPTTGTLDGGKTSDTHTFGSAAITLPTVGSMVKTDRTFNGWATTNNALTGVGLTYTPVGNITLYAVWVATQTVSYDVSSADEPRTQPSSVSGLVGAEVTLVAGSGVTKANHVLVGWSDLTKTYPLSGKFIISANADENVLTPVFLANLRVEYVLSGGTDPTTPTKVLVNQEIGASNYLVSSTIPVRTGYSFAGWQVTAYDGAVATDLGLQQPGYTVIRTAGKPDKVLLVAVWKKQFTITYNLNGATSGGLLAGKTSDTFTTDGTAVTLPAGANLGDLVRTNFAFSGWSLTPTGSALAATYSPTQDVTLYALWDRIFTVTYNLASGTSTLPTESAKKLGQQFALAAVPTRENYIFAGWSDGTSRFDAASNYTMGDFDITLTATWVRKVFEISYDFNGGTSNTVILNSSVLGGDDHTISLVVPTRTGYTFSGWATTPTGTALAGPTYTPTADTTLYAVWAAVAKSVTYAAGAAGTSELPAARTGLAQGETINLAAAMTDPNRPFLGWSDGINTYVPGQSYRIGTSDVTFTAQWGTASYTVTYDLNGGSGTAPTQTPIVSGGSFTIKSNLADGTALFIRANHDFDGWLIGEDAKAIGDTITNVTSNIVVTANWDPVIQIEFDSNGGSAVANPSVTYRGGAGITKPTDPTRTDFVFGGWSDGSTIVTWPYVPTLPVTLKAVWTQLSLAGIDPDKLVRLGTLIASAEEDRSFIGSNPTNSVNVVVPRGSLPTGTKVNIDVVSEIVRAKEIISNEVNFLVSLVVHWLAEDGTVPKTDPEIPVLVTIYNPAIKTGMVLYKIIGNEFTVLGRASKDGEVTFEIFEDPEILVAATRPDAPIEVTGTPQSTSSIQVSWVAPVVDGGATITEYTVTANTGQTCKATTTSCVISGLSPSTDYTFTVIATNSVGNSAESAASAAIKTNTPPPVIAPGGAPIAPVVPTRPTPTGPVTQTLDGRSITTTPGTAKRIVDGSLVSTIFQVINGNTLRTQFDGVTLDVRGLDRIDRSIPIRNNTLVFERNGKASLSGSGLMGGTKLRVWLLSTPTFLGEVTTKSDGSFNLSSVIPRAFPLGEHTLQLNGVSDKNQSITQTFGVTVVERAPESNVIVPGTAKKALNLSMVPTQLRPTTKQLAKTTNLAKTLPAKSVITCNSYVAAARPTAAQTNQASRIANLLCAPFRANKALTTKFTKIAPKNAATLKWAKRKPIRVQVTVVQPGK